MASAHGADFQNACGEVLSHGVFVVPPLARDAKQHLEDLNKGETFFVTSVQTMIKDGTNPIVRSLSLDSFILSKETSLKSV